MSATGLNNQNALNNGCHAELLARPGFNTSQSSQLFINCCFALSLSGVFFTAIEALQKNLVYLFWIPFTMYLVFLIWRQYSIYYIPLQFYRNKPTTDFDELITFVITLSLGAYPVICIYFQHWSIVCLAGIIGLNLIKVKQMCSMLQQAPKPASDAVNTLKDFSYRLITYIGMLGVIFALLLFQQSNLSERCYSIIVGLIVPVVVYPLTRGIYVSIRGNRVVPLSSEVYIKLVSSSHEP